MNDVLRDKLRELLATHGRPLIEDRARCEALMWLAAGEHSRGMFALVGALERKVPHAILTAPPERRGEELFGKLTRRLVADLDMDETAARWAVTSWAAALAEAPAQSLVPIPLPASEPQQPVARPASPPPTDLGEVPSLTLDEGLVVPQHVVNAPNLDRLFPAGRTGADLVQGPTPGVRCVAFAPDGRTVATAGADCAIQLWDTATGQPRAALAGHAGTIHAIAFAPGGRSLASASADGTVRIWDLTTQSERITLSGHGGPVLSVKYAPDGQALASAGADGRVRIWDVATATLRTSLEGHADEVTGVAWSPDGKTLASSSLDRTVRLWDVSFGSYWATLEAHGKVAALAYSPDGDLLVTAGHDRTVRLWNAVTAREVATFEGELEGHTLPVRCVAFAPDGTTVATGGDDEVVRIWDVASRKEIACHTGHIGTIRAVTYSPDGRWVVSAGNDQRVRRWQTPRVVRPAPRRPTGTVPPRAGSLGKALMVGVGLVVVIYIILRLLGNSSGTPPRWDRFGKQGIGNEEVRQFVGHTEGVTAVAVAADGRTVLTGSFDKTVRLWDVTTGQEVRRFDGHTDAVLSVALSADGRRALSGSLDKTVRLWDVQTGQELRRLDQQSGIRSGVTCVAFSADGKRFLATRGFAEVKHSFKGEPRMEHMEWHRPKDFLDCSITVWETDSGRQLALLLGHADEVTSAAFLPDGERVVSGSFDKTARLWDVKGQTEIRRFQGHTGEIFGIAISPDGRRLLSASGSLGPIPGKEGDKEKEKEKEPQPNPPPPAPKDYTLRLWDVETGKELRRLEGHANAVLGVAFSPDGLKAVSTSFDGTARVWDVEAGVELQRYHGHGSAIPAAVFTPDGGQVLSGGWDNNLRLWRVR